MEEQTTTTVTELQIEDVAESVTEEESTAVIQHLQNISEQNTQMIATIDNIFYTLLFIVAVVGIRVGQGFVQIFKTR